MQSIIYKTSDNHQNGESIRRKSRWKFLLIKSLNKFPFMLLESSMTRILPLLYFIQKYALFFRIKMNIFLTKNALISEHTKC